MVTTRSFPTWLWPGMSRSGAHGSSRTWPRVWPRSMVPAAAPPGSDGLSRRTAELVADLVGKPVARHRGCMGMLEADPARGIRAAKWQAQTAATDQAL